MSSRECYGFLTVILVMPLLGGVVFGCGDCGTVPYVPVPSTSLLPPLPGPFLSSGAYEGGVSTSSDSVVVEILSRPPDPAERVQIGAEADDSSGTPSPGAEPLCSGQLLCAGCVCAECDESACLEKRCFAEAEKSKRTSDSRVQGLVVLIILFAFCFGVVSLLWKGALFA